MSRCSSTTPRRDDPAWRNGDPPSQTCPAWGDGNPDAPARLLPLIYDPLRRIAREYMERERRGHTLEPTALVHEAYLRLVGGTPVDWQGRAHFYSLAARAMRRILVDHARARQRERRGGVQQRVPLEEAELVLPTGDASGSSPRCGCTANWATWPPNMNAETARRLPDFLAEMLELPPGQWDAFLAEACGDDPAFLAEVLSLAGCQSTSSDFLETPAYLHPDAAMDRLDQGEFKPGETLGDCTILELIGEGGMGEVYLADDTRLGRRVAVKLLKRHLHDTLAQRFRQEQRVLAGLTHPGIARLYDASVADGRAYLVMEYVEGEPLDQFVTIAACPSAGG